MAVINDAALISDLTDATQHTADGNRYMPFERLALAAPMVDGRYNGPFKGVIFAETFLYMLGSFHFVFDSTFNEVPIWPLLTDKDIFWVSDD